MSGRTRRAARIAAALVSAAARLVPSGERAEWLREWRGELWARAEGGGALIVPALGSFRHAFWLRRRAWARHATHFLRELRFGARALSRRPILASSAVATLAIGLGATTAVYSVVDGVLLAPLPYPGGDRLVRVHARYKEWGARDLPLSAETFTAWRERARAFESLEAYVRTHGANLVGAGTPAVVDHARVTPGFLSELLQVRPIVGTTFDVLGDGARDAGVALISESLWRERFGARADVVGTTVRVDGRVVEIMGVLPRVAILPDVDLWTPHPLRVDHDRTAIGSFVAIARLRPGVSLETAQADLEAAAARAAAIHPKSTGPFTPALTEYRAGLVRDVRTHLLLLLGAVAAVLLIACTNVANLLLARGVERGEELAVRRSLGATRAHLALQVLAEALLVAGVGGAAGVGIAVLGLEVLPGLLPGEIPLATRVGIDGRVLAFALAATVGTALLVALLPTLQASRIAARLSGRRGSSATPGRRRAGNLLLGLEVAQAAALLIAAGLMINTMWRMRTAEPGFDPEGLVFAHLALPAYAYDAARNPNGRANFADALRGRLRAVPGVRSVALATATPFSGSTFITVTEPEGGLPPDAGDGGITMSDPDEPRMAYFSRIHVDAAYVATLGLPVIAGRPLTPGDIESARPVALVNETAARAYWPGGSPLGRRLREQRPNGQDRWYTVVGVVGDFGHPGLPTQGVAELYVPLTREAAAGAVRPTVLVRHAGPTEPMLEQVRQAVWAVDPELPIPAVASAEHALGASLATTRFYTLMLGLFAGLATILASVGIYGVVAQSVGTRRREIGIRLALGAREHGVVAMVLVEALVVLLPALAAGLLAGALGSRLLQGLLYGVEPTDPATYAGVAATLATVAVVAIVLPAARAVRLDPTEALRAE